MRCLPKWALRGLSALLAELDDGEGEHHDVARDLRIAVDRCLAPSKAVKAARKPRAAKHRVRRMETSAIRAACLKRADGLCECCGGPFCSTNPPTMDHFEGGSDKRAQESVEGCWMLRPSCHRMKTAEAPSRAYWLKTFMGHCRKYGYPVERVEAQLARIVAGLAGGAA